MALSSSKSTDMSFFNCVKDLGIGVWGLGFRVWGFGALFVSQPTDISTPDRVLWFRVRFRMTCNIQGGRE